MTTLSETNDSESTPKKHRDPSWFLRGVLTLPKTNSNFPLKIGLLPQKETRKYSKHPFSGANLLLVSGRVNLYVLSTIRMQLQAPCSDPLFFLELLGWQR